MNTQSVNIQLNAATNLLTALQAAIEELPAKYRNKLPGANHIGDVLYRLSVAKAEVNGTPLPVKEVQHMAGDDLLAEIIEESRYQKPPDISNEPAIVEILAALQSK